MDLFTYLMAKNGHNTSIHEDLFSYLLGKAQGGGGEIKTATGITINIPDAKKLVNFMMTKESTQETTTGKNLAIGYDYERELNGITFKMHKNGSATVNGTATGSAFSIQSSVAIQNNWLITLSAGTYTLSGATANIRLEMFKQGESSVYISTNSTKTFTITEEKTFFIRLFVTNGTTINNETIYPQLELGSEATSWEEYTGGQPSPNPDYPQEVKTVKGSVDVKVVGKNLLSGIELGQISSSTGQNTSYSSYVRSIDYIEYNTTDTYYPSVDGTVPTNNFNGRFYNQNKEYIGYADVSKNGMHAVNITKVTTVEDDIPKYFRFHTSLENVGGSVDAKVMISKSNNLTYEAYQESIVTIPLNNNEIVGIGDYKDELLVDKSGHVYLNKVTDKYTFTGSETVSLLSYNTGGYLFQVTSKTFPISNYSTNYMNNYSVANSTSTSSTQLGSYIFNGVYRLRVPSTIATTGPQYKAWLSTANNTIYYPLEEPELIDLQTTVDLKLFKGVNNITNSEDGYMTIEYR